MLHLSLNVTMVQLAALILCEKRCLFAFEIRLFLKINLCQVVDPQNFCFYHKNFKIWIVPSIERIIIESCYWATFQMLVSRRNLPGKYVV